MTEGFKGRGPSGEAPAGRGARRKIPRSHPITYAHGPKVYTCSHCGKAFEWSAESAWFGSLQEMDDHEPLVYACGEPCREPLAAALGYPTEHPILDDEPAAARRDAPGAKPKGPTPNFNPSPTLKGPET